MARALAFEPSVLLLDEPLGALDVKIRSQLRRSLREIQQELKVTAILVTHDQEEAFELADRIGVIERGRLLEVGRPADLYRRPESEVVASFVGDANLVEARHEESGLRLGELVLPVPEESGGRSAGHWAVLFRPEQLRLARTREELADPVLGRGVVEHTLDLGSTRRVRVRLEGIPGVFPLGKHYGAAGLPMRLVMPSREGQENSLAIGETVWISAAGAHVLRRAAPRFLVLRGAGRAGSGGETDALALTRSLASAMGAEVSALHLNAASAASPKAASSGLGDVPVRYAPGDPRKALAREFAADRYDLIVVVAGEAHEDRAAEIAAHCPYPTLVLRHARPTCGGSLSTPPAGSREKLDVFLGAEQLARSVGAQATLLYVDDPDYGLRRARRGRIAENRR